MAKAKRTRARRPTPEEEADLEAALDGALGTLGGILGGMGYAVPHPGPYRLPVPSGLLAVCDLAALPGLGHVGSLRRTHDGKRATAGHVLRFAKPFVDAIVQASIGAVDSWAIAPDFNVKAVLGRRVGLVRPRSGVLVVGDATTIARLVVLPATGDAVSGGPAEALQSDLQERGVELPPRTLELALRSAATGLWYGPVAGIPLLVLHVAAKAPRWLRRGVDAEGRDVSLYMDVGRDNVQADPDLRKMARRERQRNRRAALRTATRE